MNLGIPIFLWDVLTQSRRKRTYVFQTIFLALMVLCLIPLWPPTGKGRSGAEIAETGALIFEWGGYVQVILLVLLAPATTANAITLEKDKNTLDLLLLTNAGPLAIVWGKFLSRLFRLVFLLFLTLPLLFALLTLGGVAASSILMEFVILVSLAVLGAGLGIFLSTLLSEVTGVLITGYAILAALIALPLGLELLGTIRTQPGSEALISAKISPLYDLIYLFHPSRFVATQSFPESWWICPAWCAGVGLGLVFMAGLILPYTRTLERLLSARALLDAIDRLFRRLLEPRSAIRALLPERGDPAPEEVEIGGQNPIYWKETTINIIGRFRYWWRINLVILLLTVACCVAFWDHRFDIRFHKGVVAALAGLVVMLSTLIATTTVTRERQDGSLVLLAASPVDCPTYVKGKVRGIARNISFLIVLPLLYAAVFTAAQVIHPLSLILLAIAIPIGVVASIMQGVWLSLMFRTTLRSTLAAIGLLIGEAVLPVVCCLATFNLPAACYYIVEPLDGVGSSIQATSQTSYLGALALALVFSAGAQVGYTVVVYSLIRSGFDRYIGRQG